MLLCDTDVFIEYFKGNEETKHVLENTGSEQLALSVITAMELFYGARNKHELTQLQQALQPLSLIHVSKTISQKAFELVRTYTKSHGLSIPDVLIAATAMMTEWSLFTYNSKDFRYIQGLVLYPGT